MREGIALTAFTGRGKKLAQRLAVSLNGTVRTDENLADWTQARFKTCEALIFVGAAGIAVRAIAPYIESKAADPCPGTSAGQMPWRGSLRPSPGARRSSPPRPT